MVIQFRNNKIKGGRGPGKKNKKNVQCESKRPGSPGLVIGGLKRKLDN